MHISQDKTAGDDAKCGTIEHPCRHISYAIEQIAESYDTIMIDGGCGNYSYQINSTIFIDKPLKISSLQNCVTPQKTKVTTNASSYFKALENIEISFIAFTRGSNLIATPIDHYQTISITINDSDITELYTVLDNPNQTINLTMERCNFYSAIMDRDFKKINSNPLNFNNLNIILNECTFKDSQLNVIYFFGGYFNSANIGGCSFLNSSIYGQCFPDETITFINSKIVDSAISFSEASLSLNNIILNNTITSLSSSNEIIILNSLVADESTISIYNCINTHLENTIMKNHFSLTADPNTTVTLNNVTFVNEKAEWRYLKVIHLSLLIKSSGMIEFISKENHINTINVESDGYSRDSDQKEFRFACSRNYQIESVMQLHEKFFSVYVFCTPLSSKYYSLAESVLEYDKDTNSFVKVNNNDTQQCNFEARCGDGKIFNKEIFWGHEIERGSRTYQMLSFELCPSLYCCPMSEEGTRNYQSCNLNRVGLLCGDCADGFIFPLIGLGCVAMESCKTGETYAIYLLLPVLLLVLYRYLVSFLLWAIQRTQIKFIDNVDNRFDPGNVNEDNHEDARVRNLPQENDEESHLHGKFHGCIHRSLSPQKHQEMDPVIADDRLEPVEPQPDHDEERYPNLECWCRDSVQAVLEIMLTFYQISYAMRVRTAFRIKHVVSLLIDILSIPVTLTLDIRTKLVSLCLVYTTDAISIEFFKVGPLVLCLSIAVMLIVILKTVKFLRKRYNAMNEEIGQPLLQYHHIDENTPRFDDDVGMPIELHLQRLYLTLLTIITYLPLSLFLLKLINCVSDIQQTYATFIQASVACFSRLSQTVALLVFLFCVVPLPIVLFISTKLLRRFRLTPNQFLLSITFPPLLLFFWLRNGSRPVAPFTRNQAATTYHLLQTLDGPYRYCGGDEEARLSWKPVTMLRCCVISIISVTMGSNNLFGLLIMAVALFVFAIHESKVKPYRSVALNVASSWVWLVLGMMVVINLYWLFTGVVNVEENIEDDGLTYLGKIFLFVELLILLLPVILLVLRILVYLTHKYLSKYFKNLIKKRE